MLVRCSQLRAALPYTELLFEAVEVYGDCSLTQFDARQSQVKVGKLLRVSPQFCYVNPPRNVCVMYHSYVDAIPCSSGIRAHHPRARMRDTSSNLRGVPSGCELSKAMRPL